MPQIHWASKKHSPVINGKRCVCSLCRAQDRKIEELRGNGYIWDKWLSTSMAAVIWRKSGDVWIFGMDGSIVNNPNTIVIKTN